LAEKERVPHHYEGRSWAEGIGGVAVPQWGAGMGSVNWGKAGSIKQGLEKRREGKGEE